MYVPIRSIVSVNIDIVSRASSSTSTGGGDTPEPPPVELGTALTFTDVALSFQNTVITFGE